MNLKNQSQKFNYMVSPGNSILRIARATALFTLACLTIGVSHAQTIFNHEGIWYEIPQLADKQPADYVEVADPESSEEKYSGEIVVPASVEYEGTTYSVAGVGEGAFFASDALTSVTLPESLKYISDAAFFDCTSLTSVNIPSGITVIPQMAFYNCKALMAVKLPDNLREISRQAFANCVSLECPTFPTSLKILGNNAFTGCSALGINNPLIIPSHFESLGLGVFSSCTSLKKADISDYQYPLPENLFYGCKSLKEITFNEDITEIPDFFFADCESLEYVEIPESILKIGNWAFSNCFSLKEVDIPVGLSEIGVRAFSQATGLTTVNFPYNGNIKISEGAFENCRSIKELLINGVREIGQEAFIGCTGMTLLEIMNETEFIGTKAFSNCTGLEDIYMHSSWPPMITINTFDSSTEKKANLFIPESSADAYKLAAYWSRFAKIQGTNSYPLDVDKVFEEDDFTISTGVGFISVESAAEEVMIYNLDGVLVAWSHSSGRSEFHLDSGIYIVAAAGKTLKVII